MAHQPQPAGWYPDPADPGTEIYWNGSAWTGMRRPLGGQTAAAEVGSPGGAVGAGLKSAGTGVTATWQRAGRGQRIAMAAFAAAIGVGLLLGLGQCARDYGVRSDCEKFVSSQFGPGSLRDEMIEHCIFMHKEFGTPIR